MTMQNRHADSRRKKKRCVVYELFFHPDKPVACFLPPTHKMLSMGHASENCAPTNYSSGRRRTRQPSQNMRDQQAMHRRQRFLFAPPSYDGERTLPNLIVGIKTPVKTISNISLFPSIDLCKVYSFCKRPFIITQSRSYLQSWTFM